MTKPYCANCKSEDVWFGKFKNEFITLTCETCQVREYWGWPDGVKKTKQAWFYIMGCRNGKRVFLEAKEQRSLEGELTQIVQLNGL